MAVSWYLRVGHRRRLAGGRDRRRTLGFGRPVRIGLAWLLLGLALLAVRTEHHGHVPALQSRHCLYLGVGLGSSCDFVEDVSTQLGMGDLTATEHNGDLYLVTFVEELLHLFGFRFEIALADLGPVLHFLDHHLGGLLSRLFCSLSVLVFPLPVVHDSTDGGAGFGGDLNQIQLEVAGQCERIRQCLDAQLGSFRGNDPNFTSTNAVVDAGLPDLVSYGDIYSSRRMLLWRYNTDVEAKERLRKNATNGGSGKPNAA